MSFLRDYLTFVGAVSAIALVAMLLQFCRDPASLNDAKKKYVPNAPPPPKEDTVAKIRSLYKLDLDHSMERTKTVKLKSLWLYPVRGVKGIKCDHLVVTPHGIKNDRLWVILDKKKLKPVANHNSHLITFLRQIIKPDRPDEVKLVLQDSVCFPQLSKRSHVLPIHKEYPPESFVEGGKNYRGFREDDEVNEWLSAILDVDCILVRAQPDRLMTLDLKLRCDIGGRPEDRRANFNTDGAIHLVNN